MKTAFIAVVVLSLAAHSPAYGDISVGLQCVNDCIRPDAADTSGANSAFKGLASSSTEDRICANFAESMTCVKACHADKYVALAEEFSQTLGKHCGVYVDEAITKKFFADKVKFETVWVSEYEKQCKADEAEADTLEEKCTSMSACQFGTALTSAKNGFCFDVVSISVLWQKIGNAAVFETQNGETLPSSCAFLLQPYQPEPSQPEPSCQPEPYPYEPYRRNPNRRNSYRRNHYQRNPY